MQRVQTDRPYPAFVPFHPGRSSPATPPRPVGAGAAPRRISGDEPCPGSGPRAGFPGGRAGPDPVLLRSPGRWTVGYRHGVGQSWRYPVGRPYPVLLRDLPCSGPWGIALGEGRRGGASPSLSHQVVILATPPRPASGLSPPLPGQGSHGDTRGRPCQGAVLAPVFWKGEENGPVSGSSPGSPHGVGRVGIVMGVGAVRNKIDKSRVPVIEDRCTR